MKELPEDNLEKALRSLAYQSPSPNFTGSVLSRVRQETNLLHQKKDYLPLIPKYLVGGFVFVMIVFVLLLAPQFHLIRLNPHHGTVVVLWTILLTLFGMVVLMALDRMIRWAIT